MAESYSWIHNLDIKTLTLFVFVPFALLAAVFLPFLLLSFLLTFVLIIYQEFSSFYPFTAPQSFFINPHTLLRLRSPPTR